MNSICSSAENWLNIQSILYILFYSFHDDLCTSRIHVILALECWLNKESVLQLIYPLWPWPLDLIFNKRHFCFVRLLNYSAKSFVWGHILTYSFGVTNGDTKWLHSCLKRRNFEDTTIETHGHKNHKRWPVLQKQRCIICYWFALGLMFSGDVTKNCKIFPSERCSRH